MATKAIALQRLYNQRLEGPKFQKPEGVIAWMGAVQGQEYALAKWALALRMEQTADALVEKALDDGKFLRTHVMRPTWHFVAADDIRWLLELTAPRVHQVNGTMYRRLELDDKLLRRCGEVIAGALHGGKTLTRAELGEALTEIDTSSGMRLAYIVLFAELEGIVCSGPRRGRQHTYALLEERAPHAKRLSPEEALAELTSRFFTSHGPATVKDFAWWSGLKMSDVKTGLAMLDAQLTHEEIDGETYWFSRSMPSVTEPPLRGHLLPVYDEYTIAYKKASSLLDPQYAEQVMDNPSFTSFFAMNGELIGLWRRTFERESVVIESVPLRPYSAAEHQAFEDAAQRFGDFLGMPVKRA